MNKDILICGIGGQGTVLASKIIAASAMDEGNTVHSAETIGMAQRGGSVTSHVRIGENAFSPLIPFGSADMLFAFEPSEAVRNLKYLKANGTAIVNIAPTKPVTENLSGGNYDAAVMTDYLKAKCDCVFVNSDEVCAPFGSVKFFNIILLGVAVGSGKLGLSRETVHKQIRRSVPEKFVEVNERAFEAGFALGAADRA